MTRRQLIARIAPMMVIPWIRSTTGVILPGLIETFHLTIGQAGLVSVFLESGSVAGMIALGFFIDRLGASRVVGWGLPVMGVSLIAVTVAPTFTTLAPTLFLVGIGIALTASGVNTLMAATGEQRGFYLGVLHSSFSVFAIVTPLIAGALIALGSWESYYLVVAAIAVCVTILFRMTGAEESPGAPVVHTTDSPPSESTTMSALRRISTLCLGVFALAGVQSIFITWSYLYMVTVYSFSHGVATLAPSLLWVGILIMRSGAISLSRRFPARRILIWSTACSLGVLAVERAVEDPWITMVSLVLIGMGVAGAFQLGTSWAAERIPERIGTASSAIMASASLGIGIWPWITGMAVEASDFSAVMLTAVVGLSIAGILFMVTPATRIVRRT